jgi:hypothetical protein
MAYPICLCCWDAGVGTDGALLILLVDRSRAAALSVGGGTGNNVGGLLMVCLALALDD